LPESLRDGSPRLLVSERVDDEAENCDADAAVGDIEGGKRMRERHVQIEEEEVDHVAVRETIGQVAHHTGEKERE
jgi:hypothetical protein